MLLSASTKVFLTVDLVTFYNLCEAILDNCHIFTPQIVVDSRMRQYPQDKKRESKK